jgi:hypothetical protein
VSRSPLVVAIDAACGYEEGEHPPAAPVPDRYVVAFQAVVEAAMRWSERGVPLRDSQALADALQVACDRLREMERS